ncbi:MAG: efflux RND transporter periplasmic adaptor subunit [Aureliella sp.]
MSAELKSPAGRKAHSPRVQAGAVQAGAAEDVADQSHAAAVGRDGQAVTAKPHGAERPLAGLVRLIYRVVPIVLAVGLGYWVATYRSEEDTRIKLPPAESGPKAGAQAGGEVVAVTAAPLVRRHIERAIDAVGTLHGYDELALKTKISGRVSKIYHDFADRVAPGALLLEIDPTDSLLAVEQAKRSLNSELAKWGFQEVPEPNADLSQLPTVVSAKVRLDWNKSQLARLNTLQSRGSVTAEEIEQAKTNALVAESDYANQLLLARAGAANAQLKKAELDIAEQQLRETKIYVPQRDELGPLKSAQYTITDRYVTEGAWLAAGTELFRLVIDETLKLRLSIAEKHSRSVKIGQRVEVSTLTAGEPVVGRVARIGPAVDPQTRTFQIEAEVPNEDGVLKTGGFAKARIVVADQSSADTVPTAALVTFAGVHKVFVLRGDHVAEHKVKLGEQTSEWVELIDSNLPENAQVIVSGQSQLADGSRVRLRGAESSPASESPEADTSPAKRPDQARRTGKTVSETSARDGAAQ